MAHVMEKIVEARVGYLGVTSAVEDFAVSFGLEFYHFVSCFAGRVDGATQLGSLDQNRTILAFAFCLFIFLFIY